MYKRLLGLCLLVLTFSPLSLNGQQLSAIDVALQSLENQQKNLHLEASDMQDVVVSDAYSSKHNGVHHVYLQQRYNGIPITNSLLNATIDRDLNPVSLKGQFVSAMVAKANATKPSISAKAAFEIAANDRGLNVSSAIRVLSKEKDAQRRTVLSEGDIASQPIEVELEYLPIGEPKSTKTLPLSWVVDIYTKDHQHYWKMWVDASSGEVLKMEDRVIKCMVPALGASHSHSALCTHSHTAAMMPLDEEGIYNAYPLGVESPNHGDRELLTEPWLAAPNASPFGWHDTDGITGAEFTITRGNNVYAQEDQNGNDGFGYAPDGTDDLIFDFEIDFDSPPGDYVDAAVTNLFVWNNLMHDVWYEYGFDESSGNFQATNYTNDGQDGDFVIADAQDGGGINNANFFTPDDGNNPRMQMYEWGSSANTQFQVTGPGAIDGFYTNLPGGFGPAFPPIDEALEASLILVNDGTADPTLGCEAFINDADVDGNIALIDRGDCFFVEKAANAEAAGAIAMVVCNNEPGGPITMGGDTGGLGIPCMMIGQADCAEIKLYLDDGVDVKLFVSGGASNIDGDLDNGIICHEYGHGVSIRLTGGPSSSGCLSNEEQAGEGWSDWLGLVMTTTEDNSGDEVRGYGTFAINQPVTGTGIRTYPYSTDMSVNPHTYDDIKFESIPHGVGSVWCAMIWDLYWRFVDEYGFDSDIYKGNGGNNIAMQLVTDGMKLQVCNPGFVDMRDAIIEADQLNYDGAYTCMIWEVFANRGLGYSADQGSSTSRADGTEAFDTPPLCLPGLKITKSAVDQVAAGEELSYTLTITNNTSEDLNFISFSDELPEGLSFVSASCGGADLGGGSILFPNISLAAGESFTCTLYTMVNVDNFSSISFSDDLESGNVFWSTYADESWGSDDEFELTDDNPNSGSFSWFCGDPEYSSDQYLESFLPIVVTGTAPILSFMHSYDTEATWDGGVVELSTDLVDWFDAEDLFVQNGYNSTIQENDASPISGQPAFTGNSGGYIESHIDLSSFVGGFLYVRFRFGSDGLVGGNGWYIDDINVLEAVYITNEACTSAGDEPELNACDQATTLITEPIDVMPGLNNDQVLANGIQVYPNPSHDQLFVSPSTQLQNQALNSRIQLMDIQGRQVFSTQQESWTNTITINTADLPQGMYLLTIDVNGTLSQQKVMVQH